MGSGEDNQNAPLWLLEEETIPGQVEELLTCTRLMGKQRRPPHPRTNENFQEPTKYPYKDHEHYQPKDMALPPPTSVAISLHSSDGIVTLYCSIGNDGTIGICAIVFTHSSNNILTLWTTYFPLNDGSRDFTTRHEASQFSAQLEWPAEIPPQSMPSAANHTTPEPPEQCPEGTPSL